MPIRSRKAVCGRCGKGCAGDRVLCCRCQPKCWICGEYLEFGDGRQCLPCLRLNARLCNLHAGCTAARPAGVIDERIARLCELAERGEALFSGPRETDLTGQPNTIGRPRRVAAH